MNYFTKEKIDNIKNHLYQKIIPFWNRLYDQQFGGFYGGADKDGNIIKTAVKGCVYTSRILWSYSSLYNYNHNQEHLFYATKAYEFIKNRFYDSKNKGVFWSVKNTGEPLVTDKHLYAQAFAVYGLSEYYLASKNYSALNMANELASILTKSIAFFPNNYNEQYTKDWVPTENRLIADFGIHSKITTNTLLHIGEALANIYKVTKKPKYMVAIKEVIRILFGEGYNEKHKSLFPFIGLKLDKTVISYGHNIEVSWLFDDIFQTINFHDKRYEQICLDLGLEVYDKAFNGEVVYNNRIDETVNKQRIWWIQAESLVGLINLYQKTDDLKFLNAFQKVYDYIIQHFVSPNGEWYWSVEENDEPTLDQLQAGLWKANYHNVRSLLQVIIRGEKNGN